MYTPESTYACMCLCVSGMNDSEDTREGREASILKFLTNTVRQEKEIMCTDWEERNKSVLFIFRNFLGAGDVTHW